MNQNSQQNNQQSGSQEVVTITSGIINSMQPALANPPLPNNPATFTAGGKVSFSFSFLRSCISKR